ncbi:MAG: TIGR04255 family protein [Nitrospiraceae bacterium]|nr:MAG: TIGR04255 family protein [Nitrospiraceae bacterium]
MSQSLPKLLTKCPLREVVFELRFTPTNPAAGDLLPGLLFSKMHKDYPEVVPLPMANVPRQLREQNQDLAYQPSHRLSGGPHAVLICDRAVSLNTHQYPGWVRYKEMIGALIDALKETELVKQIERFSFKYINVIEALPSESQLPYLKLKIALGDKPPIERGFLLRVEGNEGEFVTITQIAPNTLAKNLINHQDVSGLMVDVDTIRGSIGNEFLENSKSELEKGHEVAKKTFFSLLTEATRDRMEPKW